MAFNQFPSKGGIPSGATANRPSSPVVGDTYYNGTLEILEIYNGTQWVASSAPPATPSIATPTDVGTVDYASGGSLTVVFTPGSGGGTPNQYNAYTTTGGFFASSSSTTVTMTGLTPATAFTVYGTAQNNFGTTVNTPNASPVTATTRPQAPTIGTATTTGTTTTVAVTWTLNATGGKVLSAVKVNAYSGATLVSTTTAATTSSTSVDVTGLTQGTSYTFKVFTVNANGDGALSAASNSVTIPTLITIDYLVLAGGGGGSGGGGGAGGLRSTVTATGGGGSLETALARASGVNYTVTVGGGGSFGSNISTNGTNGSNSVFDTITSDGGGGGAGTPSVLTKAGSNGGCGGGGVSYGVSGTGAGGTGTTNQGYAGGAASNGTADYASAGGGGVGAVGANQSGVGGANGGAGVASSITGSSVTYGAGAKGYPSGVYSVSANIGAGGPGKPESGGGNGVSGGSGVVILRYPDTRTITIGAGLTGTESSASGGYKRATITAGTGNVSWA
jgi:hypothetical protein